MARIYHQTLSGVSRLHAGGRRQHLLKRGAALSGLAAASVLAAACGSQGGSTASPQAGATSGSTGKTVTAKAIVSTRQLTGIGTALVSSSGMTIYTPKTPPETNGNIKCTGSCLSFWFPVTTSSAHLGASGLPGKLGTIHLADGMTQLSYNGRPLYTFRLDTAAGQARGNNYTDSFNGTTFTWQAVTASGQPVGAGSPAPAPSYSYQGGGY